MANEGVDVSVVVSEDAAQSLYWDEGRELARWAEVVGARLGVSPNGGHKEGGAFLVAEVGGESWNTRWASADPSVMEPNEDWGIGRAATLCLRETAMNPSPPANSVLHARKKSRSQSGRIHTFDISNELDGPIASFGGRFWDLIEEHAPELPASFGGAEHIKSARYVDRYLRSPLSARLVSEMFHELSKRAGRIERIEIDTTPAENMQVPRKFFHNWDIADTQRKVLSGLLADLESDVEVRLLNRRQIQHQRELVLAWGDGTEFRLRLDQGLGFLKQRGRSIFDFSLSGEEQAQALARMTVELVPRDQDAVSCYAAGPARG